MLHENFNIQELLHKINFLQSTAPGQDNITNEIIKHLSESSPMVLLDFLTFHRNKKFHQINGNYLLLTYLQKN